MHDEPRNSSFPAPACRAASSTAAVPVTFAQAALGAEIQVKTLNGEDALRLIRTSEPDAVVLDAEMPGDLVCELRVRAARDDGEDGCGAPDMIGVWM